MALRLAPTGLHAGAWMGFLLANTVAAPIVVGHLFHLGPAATAGLVQRTIVLACLVSVVQALWGHRVTAIEGPAGLWLSVLIALAQGPSGHQHGLLQTLGEFRVGLLCAGVVVASLSLVGAIARLQRLFTHRVIGVYLVLLGVQLAGSFLPAAFLLHARPSGSLVLRSLAVVLVTVVVAAWGPRPLRAASVLAGLAVGWALVAVTTPGGAVLGPTPAPAPLTAWALRFNVGVVVTCIFAALINTSNTVATVRAVAQAASTQEVQPEVAAARFDRASACTSLGNAVAGLAGALGLVSLSSSSAVVRLAGARRRAPFLVACAFTAVLGALPLTARLLASLPASVAAASLLVTTAQLLIMGVESLRHPAATGSARIRVGVPLLLGLGTLALPVTVWSGVPDPVRLVVGNGLVLGVILAIVFDRLPGG